jgi:hypothetical protein
MDILTAIYIAVFFFILGAAVMGLIWFLRGLGKRGRGKSKKAESADHDLTEMARLMRDNHTQDLVVEMDDSTYQTVHELTPVLQRRLSFTSNVLVNWLAAPAPEPVPQGEPGSEPTDSAPPVPWPDESAAPDSLPDVAASSEPKMEYVPPFSVDPAAEVKPVSTKLTDVVGSIINTPPPVPQFKSIAMQINDILQAQLAGTALESRGITVNDAPDHGVMVTLDGEKYPGLKDVPDEEVRKAIRAAVLEWETRK